MQYSNIIKKISQAQAKSSFKQSVQLIAVSKTKSVEEIMKIYDQGHRDFGENYVEELVEKAQKLPDDIKWYFIGHLQSNKVNKLLNINLEQIQTVHSLKLAQKINKKLVEQQKQLDVMIQVNIAMSESKSGINPNEVQEIVKIIEKDCQQLNIKGLMMIGDIGNIEQLQQMNKMRNDLNPDWKLSMGMSDDFEEAIMQGSNYVRIGSLIFGKRNYDKQYIK